MSQPVEVYPTPNIQTQPNNSSHSNGSFGPVLIVLAVILVLLVISIVLGRICNRRYHKGEPSAHGHSSHKKTKKGKQNGNGKFHHQAGAGDHHQAGDIEFGFDKRFASAKVAANGDHFGLPPKIIPQGREPKGPVRYADDHIEFRAGAI